MAGQQCLFEKALTTFSDRLFTLTRVWNPKQASILVSENEMKPLASRKNKMDSLKIMVFFDPFKQINRCLSCPFHVSFGEWRDVDIEDNEVVNHDW